MISGKSKDSKESYGRNCEIFQVCGIRKRERTIFHLRHVDPALPYIVSYFLRQCLYFRNISLFLPNKSEHRGTSSPQSELGYIVPGSLCAFMGPGRCPAKPKKYNKMETRKTWEETKRELLKDVRTRCLEKGYSKEYTKSYIESYGHNFEIGYFKGSIKGSVEVAYRILNSIGFPVKDHQVNITMTYEQAHHLLRETCTATDLIKTERKEMKWSDIAEAFKSGIRQSNLLYLFSRESQETCFEHCAAGMEQGFFKAYMENVAASAVIELEETGFPVKGHYVYLKMTYEDVRERDEQNKV